MPKAILYKINMASGTSTQNKSENIMVSNPTSPANDVGELLNKLYASAPGKLELLVKESYNMEYQNFLVKIQSSDSFIDKLEYARVAANILRRYANAEVDISGSEKDNIVELTCGISGDPILAEKLIYTLCSLVSSKMKDNLKKSGRDINIPILVLTGYLSEYNDIDCISLVKNNRKFNFLRLGGKNG
jgi:hypothetical protein